MKVRNGFVSNSSSSSFIMCYGLITTDAAKELIVDDMRCTVYTEAELEKEIARSKWSTPLQCDYAGVSIDMIKTGNPDQLHFIFDKSEDIYEDEDGDTNYDVSYSDFDCSTYIDKTFTEDNGFSNIEVQYGAGRDG